MKKLLFFLLLAVFSVSFSQAQQWVNFSSSTPIVPEINLLTNTSQSVSFEVTIYGIYSQDTIVNGTSFRRLAVPSGSAINPAGSPELPVLRYQVAIPECSGTVVSYNVLSSISLSPCWVYPVPQMVLDSSGMFVEQFFFDPIAYAQPCTVEPVAVITSDGSLRAQRYVEIMVQPFEYCPVTSQLSVIENVVITLTFTSPTGNIRQNVGIFNKVAANAFINYEDDGMSALINDKAFLRSGFTPGTVAYYYLTDTIQACSIVGDYLIIVDPDLITYPIEESEIFRLAKHRAHYNGFDVAIVNLSQILSLNFEYTNPIYIKEQKMRSLIRRVYEGANAYHTEDGKLAYVLLVGDNYENNTGMPTSYDHDFWNYTGYSYEQYACDYYFTCVTKDANGNYDDIGDLFLGRFSVEDIPQLFNMVNKSVNHETKFIPGTWRKTAGFTHGWLSQFPQYTSYANFVNNLLDENGWDSYFVETLQIKEPTLQYWNEGVVYSHYHALGGMQPTTWEDNLNVDTVALRLHNNKKTPFIVCIAHQSGRFDNSNCMAEFITRFDSINGAVGYVGASRASLSAWHDEYPAYLSIQGCFPYFLISEKISIAGELMRTSQISAWNGVGHDDIKWHYNYFGDPALNILAEPNGGIDCPLYLTENMYINSGETVVIPCDTVYCAENVSIIVQPGGTLIVDGSVITNMNNGAMWQGIKVMYDRTGNGAVLIKNGATIANAVCGVHVINQRSLEVRDAFFVNNTIGIKIDLIKNNPKRLDDKTFITDTEFIIDENYLADPLYFNAHLITRSVRPVLVSRCTFSNSNPMNPIMYYPEEMIVGIKTFNTDIGVQQSTFSGFLRGISVRNSGTIPSTSIHNNDFSNFYCGLQLIGVNNPSIVGNNFTLSFATATGLYTEESTGYTITENTFWQNNSTVDNIGIKIAKSGSDENVVYKNYFTNMDVGINAIDNNSSQTNNPYQQPARMSGLQFQCNEFTDTYSTDILVGYFPFSPLPPVDHSVRRDQGNLRETTGNKFWGQIRYNISNFSTYPINYYFYNNYPEIPLVQGLVNLFPLNIPSNCPPRAYSYFDEDLESALALYDEWNTEYELWLSKLLSTEMGSEEYYTILNEVSYYSALKDNYFNSIISAFLNAEEKEKGRGGTEEIEQLKFETLRFIFGYRGNYTDNLSIAETFLAEINYEGSGATIDKIYKNFELTEEQVDEINGLQTYIKWLQQLEKEEKTIYTLTEKDIDNLIKYLETNSGRGAVFVNNILCGLYGICINLINPDYSAPHNPTEEESNHLFNSALQIENNALSDKITLNPNPTTGQLTIYYGQLSINNVDIFDVYGRKLSSNHSITSTSYLTIDISNLNSGIYFVKIVTEQGEIVKKVVKQ